MVRLWNKPLWKFVESTSLGCSKLDWIRLGATWSTFIVRSIFKVPLLWAWFWTTWHQRSFLTFLILWSGKSDYLRNIVSLASLFRLVFCRWLLLLMSNLVRVTPLETDQLKTGGPYCKLVLVTVSLTDRYFLGYGTEIPGGISCRMTVEWAVLWIQFQWTVGDCLIILRTGGATVGRCRGTDSSWLMLACVHNRTAVVLAVLQVVVIHILARFRSCFPCPFVIFLDVKDFLVCGEHSSFEENAQVEIQTQFYEHSWRKGSSIFF